MSVCSHLTRKFVLVHQAASGYFASNEVPVLGFAHLCPVWHFSTLSELRCRLIDSLCALPLKLNYPPCGVEASWYSVLSVVQAHAFPVAQNIRKLNYRLAS